MTVEAHNTTNADPVARDDRERITELEFEAQRRELEVRFAYEETLERRLSESQERVEALQGRIVAEAQRIAVERQRLAAQSADERERSADARRALDETRRELDLVRRERDDVRQELDAERQRLSYRAVQSLVAKVKKRRIVLAVVRKIAALLRG